MEKAPAESVLAGPLALGSPDTEQAEDPITAVTVAPPAGTPVERRTTPLTDAIAGTGEHAHGGTQDGTSISSESTPKCTACRIK